MLGALGSDKSRPLARSLITLKMPEANAYFSSRRTTDLSRSGTVLASVFAMTGKPVSAQVSCLIIARLGDWHPGVLASQEAFLGFPYSPSMGSGK
jgi:hypothetical protein